MLGMIRKSFRIFTVFRILRVFSSLPITATILIYASTQS